ncbi:MAG: hypothetical protein WC073_16995 [Sterolibacterium sp.]
MTPAELIDQAKADGVTMTLTPSGRLRLNGNQEAIWRWLGAINQYQGALIAVLSAGRIAGPLANDQQVAGATITTAENKTHHGAESGPHAAQRSMTNG